MNVNYNAVIKTQRATLVFTFARFRLEPPEASLHSRVYELELPVSEVLQNVFVRFDPRRVPLGPEVRARRCGVHVSDRVTLVQPVLHPAVQHGHGAVTEEAEHPPHARRRERAEVAAVVHDHVRVVTDPQLSHVVGELAVPGQHVVKRGRPVAALVDVEERRAWDVALRELLTGIPVQFR